jgi:hypothetical protein
MNSVITDPEKVRKVLEGVREASRNLAVSTGGGDLPSTAMGRSPPAEVEARIPMPPRLSLFRGGWSSGSSAPRWSCARAIGLDEMKAVSALGRVLAGCRGEEDRWCRTERAAPAAPPAPRRARRPLGRCHAGCGVGCWRGNGLQATLGTCRHPAWKSYPSRAGSVLGKPPEASANAALGPFRGNSEILRLKRIGYPPLEGESAARLLFPRRPKSILASAPMRPRRCPRKPQTSLSLSSLPCRNHSF